MLVAFDKAVGVADIEFDPRLLVPTVLRAFQIIIEETQLQVTPVIGVEMRPVFQTVNFQPLFFGSSAHETFAIAARMQALSAPVGGRQKRYFDILPDG